MGSQARITPDEDIYTKDGTTDYKNVPANKKITGTWKACPYILGNECCERLAYYGMGTNLVNYLKVQLNQHNVTAINNVTNWSGTCYITPLLGAFLADAYLGRYWTIAIFSIIYVLGMSLLTLSASVPGLRPPCEKGVCDPSTMQSAVAFIALYTIALGTGGIKPMLGAYRVWKESLVLSNTVVSDGCTSENSSREASGCCWIFEG